MNNHKITAAFCLAVGFLNIGMWTFLILTGQVIDFHNAVVSYLFHWTSEFLTAILLIISGILLLSHPSHPHSRILFFVAAGFLINAINGAFWYYLINFNLPILLMSGLVLAGSIFLGVKNYDRRNDFILLAIGIILYGTINLAGYGFARGESSVLIHTLPMLIVSAGILVSEKSSFYKMN